MLNKKVSIFLIALLAPSMAHAIGTSVFPVNNQTTTYVIDASIAAPLSIVTVNLPSSANNARVQMPLKNTNSCTLLAQASNTGNIFFGGNTVTNSIGVNEGWPLGPGEAYGPITTTNSNLIFVATDTASNKVKIFCN